MIGVSTTRFNLIVLRKRNVWYSVKDGNWSDPTIWMSNGSRKNSYPQNNDIVNINHTIVCNLSLSITDIFISGTIKFNSSPITLTVNGNLRATGTVDQSDGANTIILNGTNNSINNFLSGTNSTIQYNSIFDQPILPLNYNHLNIYGGITSRKYLNGDLLVTGNLRIGCTLDANSKDIIIGGTTIPHVRNANIISNVGILMIGNCNGGGGTSLNITGTASVEMKSGLNINSVDWNWSDTSINFTTNNQTISLLSANWTVGNLTVNGPITVNTASGNSPLIVTGVLNGTTTSSIFNNNGYMQFNSSSSQMTTGVFNYRNSTNSTIGFAINGNFTLPYSAYENLFISGSGTKSLCDNTVINRNLTVSTSILEMAIYDLYVTGNTVVNTSGSGLKKSGGGNVVFTGSLTLNTGSLFNDFSVGNPSIEIGGGLIFNNGMFNFGSGDVKFTSNNQTISSGSGNSIIFSGNVIIDSGISLTKISDGNSIIFNGTLNGISATSTYNNQGMTFYSNGQQPMQTGILNCSTVNNSFYYNLNGNQDVTPVTYKNLILSTGGIKKLLGNVSVLNSYILTPPATLDLNGFVLTNP